MLALDVTSGDFILSVVALVLGLVGAPLIVRRMTGGFDERGSEDVARAYFDEHGRWPDETDEDVAARRATASSRPPADAVADEQGRV